MQPEPSALELQIFTKFENSFQKFNFLKTFKKFFKNEKFFKNSLAGFLVFKIEKFFIKNFSIFIFFRGEQKLLAGF